MKTEKIVFEQGNKQVLKQGSHFFTRVLENGESFESGDFNTFERAKANLNIASTVEEKLSKHSKINLAVIENFLLHLTHCSDELDYGFDLPQTYTPEELYRVANEYILEDHVDGEGWEEEEPFWFEVFTSDENESTETIATFDSLKEAEQYVADHSEQDLWIDKWQYIDGQNVKLKI